MARSFNVIIMRISVMLAIASLSFPAARAEPPTEYKLATGDVIEIVAIGAPDIRSRATVDVDGRALFPLIGPVNASGLTISTIQSNVREVLPTKVFRRRSDDGREYPIVLTPDEILVSIAEYRPIYVNGDVAKPGPQPYRPGLTVRQAIASAGGFDVMRFRSKDPFLESSDLKGDYDSLWIEFAREQAREHSLREQLGESVSAQLQPIPVPQSVVAEINRVEAERSVASTSDHQKEKAHLMTALQKEEHRINVLVAERDKEKQDADSDAADFEATKANLQRGFVPTTRVAEARRLALYSATRALQTSALIAQLDSQRHEFESRLDRLDDQRRARLLEELQNCSVKLAGIRARLQAVGEKLSYAGMVRSQLVRGGGDRPNVTIFRSNHPKSTEVGADSYSILMPGDVVEVAARIVSREQN
jgi:polysaccharide export outer membrane protein